MGPLSNLHRRARALLGLAPATADGLPMASLDPPGVARPAAPVVPLAEGAIHYRQPRRDEVFGAVRMLMSLSGRPADDAQVAEFLRNAPARRVDLSLLRVAERRGRLLWSLLPVLSPGHTALLLSPPVPTHAADAAAAGELVDRLCADLRGRGVHLAQTLLDPADAAARSLFAARGFAAMSELIYLTGEPRRRFVPPPTPPGLEWVSYSAATRDLFKRAIAATYERSLDCPALNGLRDMDDVLAGHQATGEFDPAHWRLLCRPPPAAGGDPDPLGVLLLARVPAANAVELVYLGLAPAARGRRLGDHLVKRALAGVVELRATRLTLAVDAKNEPALKLYYRNGMARAGSKVAMMRDLRGGA